MAKIQFIFKIDNNESFFLLKREYFFIFHNFRSKKVILPFCHNKVNFVFLARYIKTKPQILNMFFIKARFYCITLYNT